MTAGAAAPCGRRPRARRRAGLAAYYVIARRPGSPLAAPCFCTLVQGLAFRPDTPALPARWRGRGRDGEILDYRKLLIRLLCALSALRAEAVIAPCDQSGRICIETDEIIPHLEDD